MERYERRRDLQYGSQRFDELIKLGNISKNPTSHLTADKIVERMAFIQPFVNGDILYMTKTTPKPKVRKTDSGWQETGEMQWWLEDYRKENI